MAEAVRAEYDPAEMYRGEVAETGGGEEKGGLHPERHASPTLRLFTSTQGVQWVMYGTITGGEQDPAEKWIELLYDGIIRWKGERVGGSWLIRIEGERLEPLAQYLGRQIKTKLHHKESSQSRENPYKVTDITISPYQPVDLET